MMTQTMLAQGRPAPGGEIWLVGAGPGDVELLTLKALRAIQQADVVVFDRLVSAEILDLAPPQALRIDVGKTRGCHRLPQEKVNQLLVELAQAGQRVIRLKGGDPFIFGRGGEEMAYAQSAGIACHVVPGITAATGCAAAVGLPLTHRDCAQSVRFVTGHARDGEPQLEWATLADPRQTLVFYMGLSHGSRLCQRLIEHGLSAQTPAAIIERGTQPDQRLLIATLATLPALLARYQPQSPSLLIVGDVVRFCRHPALGVAESSAAAANKHQAA
ncbi:uroporphyrinogen-III C-methyltransferase [Brenneria populi subsp. brevivirga]|uniref:uroporphyrinogen-III C-methyltransferase n=1 Tax=Brenneria populi TaxID=1505588 RepID=UPI002E18553F|nr:uroporphyrinogen-III C-methyltransferase [Brenneria populi subsp. brevivirga]